MADKLIINLWHRYFGDGVSREEKETLAQWIESTGEDEDLKELLEDSWNDFKPEGKLSEEKATSMFTGILNRAREVEQTPAPVIAMKPKFWKRIAVAAAILLLIGLGSYLLFFNKTGDKSEIVSSDTPGDIKAPEITRATIRLSNGKTIYLDSVKNGSLAREENVQILKNEAGNIAYVGSADQTVYNTLSNPRGSRVVDLTLSDGTKVWLNSESSLKYPVAFVGDTREVEITGEAYFEVKHDATKPFLVRRPYDEATVKVLGTHFNINAYPDEVAVRITLLEGSVQVMKGDKMVKLIPGQQSMLDNAGTLTINKQVNTEEVMAWINGYFYFEKADVQTVMRQLARWYDITIQYKGNITREIFGGKIQRNLNLSAVMDILKTIGVEYKVEGKTLIVGS